tara:strand:- start:328 stop:543 length:216 start_codon:yes stop_codon:yes gene_type:complete
MMASVRQAADQKNIFLKSSRRMSGMSRCRNDALTFAFFDWMVGTLHIPAHGHPDMACLAKARTERKRRFIR